LKTFRAVRYDERVAGPLESLVAPPYDVIDDAARARLASASPYNVVHLTLPEDEARAAQLWRAWRAEGALHEDEAPALWWLAQDYTGPDGVARRRDGLVCGLHVEPYSARVVIPHEQTHAGPKAGRLRLLRTLRAHVEPIFLLYDGRLPAPAGDPLVDVELDGVRSRLWRLEGPPPAALADASLLIADGHHRYETALAFHEEEGSEESAWLEAVVVPTEQEGLTIFPTHRIAGRVAELPPLEPGELDGDPRATVEVYARGGGGLLRGVAGELDSELADRYAAEIRYTPSADEARAAVDAGEAAAAFLLRPPTVAQVRAVAEEGRVLPPKSTYFFPKLTSGLLFMPL
jgi:uncharacterized protein (DUF1015 family)